MTKLFEKHKSWSALIPQEDAPIGFFLSEFCPERLTVYHLHVQIFLVFSHSCVGLLTRYVFRLSFEERHIFDRLFKVSPFYTAPCQPDDLEGVEAVEVNGLLVDGRGLRGGRLNHEN